MSASIGSEGQGSGGQDFDLNLAPIIDCFTVLITFLLASASFLSIGLLDAGISVVSAQPSESKPKEPPVQVQIYLKKEKQFQIKISGKENRNHLVKEKQGEWDLNELQGYLGQIKLKWSLVDGAVLEAQNGVEYRDVVASMEIIRKSFPAVMLGGF